MHTVFRGVRVDEIVDRWYIWGNAKQKRWTSLSENCCCSFPVGIVEGNCFSKMCDKCGIAVLHLYNRLYKNLHIEPVRIYVDIASMSIRIDIVTDVPVW